MQWESKADLIAWKRFKSSGKVCDAMFMMALSNTELEVSAEDVDEQEPEM